MSDYSRLVAYLKVLQSAKTLRKESLIAEFQLNERCNKLVALSLHPTTNCTSTLHAPSSLLSETPLKVSIGAGSKCQLTEEYAHANLHQSSLRVEVLLRRGYCASLLEFQTFHFRCAVLDIWDEARAVILKQRYGSITGPE